MKEKNIYTNRERISSYPSETRFTLNGILISTKRYENPVKVNPSFLFRGQSNSDWSLVPSFTRILNEKKLTLDQSLELENESIMKFSIAAKNLLDIRQTIEMIGSIDKFGWFTKMQHFHAPTRCLDWTSSSIVAAYFACQEDNIESDGIIWIIDNNKIENYNNQKIIRYYKDCLRKKLLDHNRKLCDDLDVFLSKNLILDFENLLFRILAFSNDNFISIKLLRSLSTNERIEAQQGFFSVCTNPQIDHKDEFENAEAIIKTIIIPFKAKRKILSQLYSLNINANTLFPGIDGLGQSIQEFCYLWDIQRPII